MAFPGEEPRKEHELQLDPVSEHPRTLCSASHVQTAPARSDPVARYAPVDPRSVQRASPPPRGHGAQTTRPFFRACPRASREPTQGSARGSRQACARDARDDRRRSVPIPAAPETPAAACAPLRATGTANIPALPSRTRPRPAHGRAVRGQEGAAGPPPARLRAWKCGGASPDPDDSTWLLLHRGRVGRSLRHDDGPARRLWRAGRHDAQVGRD